MIVSKSRFSQQLRKRFFCKKIGQLFVDNFSETAI